MAIPPNGIPCKYCGKRLCSGDPADKMPAKCHWCGASYRPEKRKNMKPKTQTKQVVYIGDQFYSQSGSAMSSVYEVRTVNGKKEYKRYDYGFLQCDLASGIRVNIRPATDKELGMFARKLLKVQADLGEVKRGV